ncbi:vacuolar H+transporting two-sector ATPase F subunit [Candidatus Nitrosopumilus sediminis]|uniref:Vacuolar H+transporting two-sector ATPase F subunit n=1 Tax=Candidatus Nitrosopumilus sediminis TaxID=1229909 RepID=K0BDE0_9ARCH|nr:vacuolar H+transporting two-sector ATPase F subunit [Candidatus Nitrosopumilus sediminis]
MSISAINSLVFQTKSTFPDLLSPKRVKLERTKFSTVKIFTVGSKSFVTSFQLAGIPGKISENPQKALEEIKTLTDDSDVGLVLVSDDITESINDELTALRAEKSTLVFALPATGSEKTEVDYRVMLKKILGV